MHVPQLFCTECSAYAVACYFKTARNMVVSLPLVVTSKPACAPALALGWECLEHDSAEAGNREAAISANAQTLVVRKRKKTPLSSSLRG